MPTLVAHAAVPLAIGLAAGRRRVPAALLLLGIVASVLPDADVVAFRLGIPYADGLGHRGASHSLLGAWLIALALWPFAVKAGAGRVRALVFLLTAALSHGLLDMLTNGGLGVAVWWPWSTERFFLPCRVIQVSPIGVHRIFGATGWAVARSELLWVWLPAVLLAIAGRQLIASNARSHD